MISAPYNFIPFHTTRNAGGEGRSKKSRIERVLVRYQDMEDLPRHDRIDPELKTGEIHVTMTAETPVFVSDYNQHFYRGANGKFMIPGSTIRGMTRENMQILGFGLMRPVEDLEELQIYFREISSARDAVGFPLKEYYRDALDVVYGGNIHDGFNSIPRKVKAGYLRCEKSSYYIQPTRGPYIKIPRDDAALEEAGFKDNEYAKTIEVAYNISRGNQLIRIVPLKRAVSGMNQGVLLYTGKSIGNKRNARYLFPAADEDTRKRIPISKEDELSYRVDWEDRINSLKGAEYNPSFWALPDEGKEKPVFYAEYDGHIFFGMSLFLRIGFSHKLSYGLPGHADTVNRQAEYSPLDYIHAVLGFAEDKCSYRSRVSFGDFEVQDDPQEGEPVLTILGQPKPSWYPGYVTDGKHYNEDEFYLRGYKMYWLKKEAKAEEVPEGKESVASTLRPLPAGTSFRGVIRYKNLHPDELGLLLWALRLEEGCCQSISMGKPYGYGRMTLTIDGLKEYDLRKMYTPDGLCMDHPVDRDSGKIARYIEMYDKYVCEHLYIKKPKESPSIRSLDVIMDFFYMRSSIKSSDDEKYKYMTLEEHKNLEDVLPSVQEIRETAEKEESSSQAASGEISQEAPPEDAPQKEAPPMTIEEMRRMLAQRHNAR